MSNIEDLNTFMDDEMSYLIQKLIKYVFENEKGAEKRCIKIKEELKKQFFNGLVWNVIIYPRYGNDEACVSVSYLKKHYFYCNYDKSTIIIFAYKSK